MMKTLQCNNLVLRKIIPIIFPLVRIEKAEVTVGEQKYIYQYTYDELGILLAILK